MPFFKLSPEVIVTILRELDPDSLWRFCTISRTVVNLVKQHKALEYKHELAITGMQDGPANDCSPTERLQQLLTHKQSWPTLSWSIKDKFRVHTPVIMGVSGGYFYHVRPDPAGCVLGLDELQSFRSGRPEPSRLRLTCNYAIQGVAIDQSQSILVASELFRPNNDEVWIRLHFQRLGEETESPIPPFPFFTGWGEIGESVSLTSMEICGGNLGVSIRLDVGLESSTRLILIDWRSPERMAVTWVNEIISFGFINEGCVIVASHPEEDDDEDGDGDDNDAALEPAISFPTHTYLRPPTLTLHDITDLKNSEDSHLRAFELPEQWGRSTTIQIIPNKSPRSESEVLPGTLFYPNPGARVFVLAFAFQSGQAPQGYSRHNLLVINESFFMSSLSGKRDRLPWDRWRRHCLIRELSDQAHSLNVVGRRLLFSEAIPVGSAHDQGSLKSRVRLIDFNPLAVDCLSSINTRVAPPWTWIGRWTTITAVESLQTIPYIRTRTVDAHKITAFFATEDNLVLVFVYQDQTFIDSYTFGSLPS